LPRRSFGSPTRPDDARCEIRFDVVLVTPGRIPRHIANAFDATR
jgi:Holliday junction resolvase-like predicted endonuclease